MDGFVGIGGIGEVGKVNIRDIRKEYLRVSRLGIRFIGEDDQNNINYRSGSISYSDYQQRNRA